MEKSPETEHSVKAFGWAARDSSGVLSPFKFSRRETGEKDVKFKVLYCGICHTDLHFVKNGWGTSIYPLLPGHEIVGMVTEVGSKVQKFKVGDKVGVGGVIESCRSCDNCVKNLENYCPKMLLTYTTIYYDGTVTYGGYSDIMVTDEHFVWLLTSTYGESPNVTVDWIVEVTWNIGRKIVAGSNTGGLKETQEMLDFAAKHNVTANVEVIPMDYVNTAMERLEKADVRYRFVIDIGNTLKAPSA